MVTLETSFQEIKLVGIGASAGGVSAVQQILRGLSPAVEVPIVVVQHLAKQPRGDLRAVYGHGVSRNIIEVEDKMPLRPRTVYMAAPDYHILVEKDACFALSQDEPVHFSRPSIDVFFESAAESFGKSIVAILLTGANRDGAEGLCRIREKGGLTIVQEPDEAECDTMPKAALSLCAQDKVLRIAQIAPFINALLGPDRIGLGDPPRMEAP